LRPGRVRGGKGIPVKTDDSAAGYKEAPARKGWVQGSSNDRSPPVSEKRRPGCSPTTGWELKRRWMGEIAWRLEGSQTCGEREGGCAGLTGHNPRKKTKLKSRKIQINRPAAQRKQNPNRHTVQAPR